MHVTWRRRQTTDVVVAIPVSISLNTRIGALNPRASLFYRLNLPNQFVNRFNARKPVHEAFQEVIYSNVTWRNEATGSRTRSGIFFSSTSCFEGSTPEVELREAGMETEHPLDLHTWILVRKRHALDGNCCLAQGTAEHFMKCAGTIPTGRACATASATG